jgi:hypothetical protein
MDCGAEETMPPKTVSRKVVALGKWLDKEKVLVNNPVKGLRAVRVTSPLPDLTFDSLESGIVDVRDFQTAGIVAHARGCAFYNLKPGKLNLLGECVQVNKDRLEFCINDIDHIVDKL